MTISAIERALNEYALRFDAEGEMTFSGEEADPSSDQPHIRVFFAPAPTAPVEQESGQRANRRIREAGAFALEVRYPADVGTGPLKDEADKLFAWFDREDHLEAVANGQKFGVRIITVSMGQIAEGEARNSITITVQWLAFRPTST